MQKKDKKIKVVWFCNFTNSFVQEKIKPWKKIGEIAPWISNLIKIFENSNFIELHVVSQHKWLSTYKYFEKNGIFYHFVNKDIPLLGIRWPNFFRFNHWTDYYFFKKRIASIVNGIKPDIIHMHGAENEFCTVITQFYKKYPVLITIQGFIHKTSGNSKTINRRIRKEFEILKMFDHIGYRTETMGKDIKAINPDAELHWHNYPVKVIELQKAKKKYDIVFFARITKDKGIIDLLKAVSIIKKEKSDISLCVIGSGKTGFYKKLAEDLEIQNNIYWAGFLPTQRDVHKLASAAKISVLPTYHDIISGTIIESLFLELPVVAYNVGSIHEVNMHEEIVSLVDKGAIQNLAKSIKLLLNNKKLLEDRATKGKKRALEMFAQNNNQIRMDLLKAYKAVINDFKN